MSTTHSAYLSSSSQRTCWLLGLSWKSHHSSCMLLCGCMHLERCCMSHTMVCTNSLLLAGCHCDTCSNCNDCRELDLCRDPALQQGSWACPCCGAEYDAGAIEARLVAALQGRVKEYVLQDLNCTQCKQVCDVGTDVAATKRDGLWTVSESALSALLQ